MRNGVHTVSAYHRANGKTNRVPNDAAAFDSGLLQSGDTFEHAFEVEGVYDYHCVPHEGMGMVGSVIVGDPPVDPTTQPGLAPPGDDVVSPDAVRDLNRRTAGILGGELPRNTVTPGTETATPDNSSTTSAPDGTGIEVTESVSNYRFSPDVIQIEPGDTVTWSIEGGMHTVTAYHPANGKTRRVPNDAAAFDSGFLQPGATFSHTFEVEGVYDYYCMPHEGMGMVGSVVVGAPEPDPSTQPGLSEPADDVGAPDAIRQRTATAIELLGGTPPASPDGTGVMTTPPSTPAPTSTPTPTQADGEPSGGELSGSVDVSIPGRRFSPDLVRVAVGGTVTWTWNDDAHSVTAYPDRVPSTVAAFDSGIRMSGDTFSHTFEVEGVYDYYCMPHKDKGMVGSVVVGNPDTSGGEPGLSAPTQSGEEGAALSALNDRAVNELSGGEGNGSGSSEHDVIDAGTMTDVDGTISIEVLTVDGTVQAGRRAPIAATFEGKRLANAPVEVEGTVQGNTDRNGEFSVSVPSDLESGDTCRIEIRVDGARGRVEVPVSG